MPKWRGLVRLPIAVQYSNERLLRVCSIGDLPHKVIVMQGLWGLTSLLLCSYLWYYLLVFHIGDLSVFQAMCVCITCGVAPRRTCALQVLLFCCFSGLEAWFTVGSGWATHCRDCNQVWRSPAMPKARSGKAVDCGWYGYASVTEPMTKRWGSCAVASGYYYPGERNVK